MKLRLTVYVDPSLMVQLTECAKRQRQSKSQVANAAFESFLTHRQETATTRRLDQLTRIRRQWFSKRKSVMAILKEVMTNESSALLDTDAHNKALDADAALQELGSDLIGEAYVTATVTVWDEGGRTCRGREAAAGRESHPGP